MSSDNSNNKFVTIETIVFNNDYLLILLTNYY